MPAVVTIRDTEGYRFLLSTLRRSVERQDRLADDVRSLCRNLLQDFEAAAISDDPDPTPAPAPKPRAQRGSRKVYDANLCSDHPKYQAKRTPRTDCAQCWAAYERMNPHGSPTARRKKKALSNR